MAAPSSNVVETLSGSWEKVSDGTDTWYHNAQSGEVRWDLPPELTGLADIAASLPPGWSVHQDDSGEVFYVNPDGESTWQKPDGGAQGGGAAEADAYRSGSPRTVDSEGEQLPDGWLAYRNADGDTYYYEEATQTTSWDKPRARARDAAGEELPDGWVERKDATTGRVFYYHRADDRSMWADPEHPGLAAAIKAQESPTHDHGRRGLADAVSPAARAMAAHAAEVETGLKGGKTESPRGAGRGRATSLRGMKLLRTVVRTRMVLGHAMSKAKQRRLRRGIFDATDSEGADGALITPKAREPKSREALDAIQQGLSHYMFHPLLRDERHNLVHAMHSLKVAAGEAFIQRMQKDSTVFILERGGFKATEKAHTVAEKSTPGSVVGERALLYNTAREMTVVATVDSVFWCIEAKYFRSALVRSNRRRERDRAHMLQEVPQFKEASMAVLTEVARLMEETQVASAQPITLPKQPARNLYIVESGTVSLERGGGPPAVLSSGAAFGLEALELDDSGESGKSSYAHRVFGAEDDTVCLRLSIEVVEDKIAPLQTLLSGELGRRASMYHKGSLRKRSSRDHHTSRSTRKADAAGAAGAGGEQDMADIDALAVTVEEVEIEEDSFDSEHGVVAKHFRLEDCEDVGILGEGCFGVVKLVRYDGACVALKRIRKKELVDARQSHNVLRECRLLAAIDHPFVVSFLGTAQDETSVYMLLELIHGGELWSLIYGEQSALTKGSGGMSDEHARFYTAIVVEVLDYLHSRGVAYRDMKPENLLVCRDGYLKLVDFGFSKSVPFEAEGEISYKTYTMLGSPDYVPPEVLLRQGHDSTADWWSLGALVYEMLTGGTPFAESNQLHTFERATKGDVKFPDGFVDAHPDAADLISKLLTVEPLKRLGNPLHGGAGAIRAHQWFDGFDWEALRERRMAAPFAPTVKSDDDRSNFELAAEVEADGGEYEDDPGVPFDDSDGLFKDF